MLHITAWTRDNLTNGYWNGRPVETISYIIQTLAQGPQEMNSDLKKKQGTTKNSICTKWLLLEKKRFQSSEF